jgi:Gpi18-like mannosyltransferase
VQRVLDPWYRWDAVWYLRIATEGYIPGDARIAWPPVYPLATRLLGALTGGQLLLASILVSLAALIGVGVLLYREFLELSDEASAHRALRTLLLFPTAFYLFVGYSESTFLLFVLLAWRAARRERWVHASLWGALATLTRFNGIFLLLPLLYLWWRARERRDLTGLLSFGALPAVFLGWSAFTKLRYELFPWEALNQFWEIHSDWPWVGIWTNLQSTLRLTSLRIYYVNVDLAAVLLFLLLTLWAFRRLPFEYGLLMIGLGWTTVVKISDSGFLLSASRYVLPLFPAYLLLGEIGRLRVLRYAWWLSSGALMLHLASEYIRWHWVA